MTSRRQYIGRPGDGLPARHFDEHDQRDMISEVGVRKERALVVGKAALHHEEPALQRLARWSLSALLSVLASSSDRSARISTRLPSRKCSCSS
jgi:hypothetical protein